MQRIKNLILSLISVSILGVGLIIAADTWLDNGSFVLAHNAVANADPIIYLPIIMGGSGVPTTPGDNTLTDGGKVAGVDGVTVGAVSGTLTATLAVTISQSTAPLLALPDGVQAHGSYYELGSDRDVYALGDKTFILGLPVPAGTPTDTLGVAVYASADSEDPANWFLLPGRYDAVHNLLLIALPHLAVVSRTAVLVSHPSLQSPINNPAAAVLGTKTTNAVSATRFEALCIFADQTLLENCEIDKTAVESELQIFYDQMISTGYPEPHLYIKSEAFNIDNPSVLQSNTSVILIYPSDAQCAGNLGYYWWKWAELNLCAIPFAPLSNTYKQIIRHEYFHATQAAFPGTWPDFVSHNREQWITEGTASVAELSDQYGMKRSPIRDLHFVDHSLKSIDNNDEYSAQDFWVFLGQASGSGLDWFITLFEQGATTDDVINWIGSKDILRNWYWRWVKNQVMVEESIDFGGKLSQPCTLQTQTVETLRSLDMFNDDGIGYPGTLPPLTSHVIQLIIAPELEGLSQMKFWLDNDIPIDDPDLSIKVYVDGETCTSVPDGERILYNLTSAKKYYLVVSNASPDTDKNYLIFFD